MTPGGSLVLGDARDDEVFVPLVEGQELAMEAGPQGGVHFIIKSRISGLEPGDATTLGLEENPRSRYALLDENGGVIYETACPSTLGYADKGSGILESPRQTYLVLFGVDFASYFDKEVVIHGEVVDINGRYASHDTHVIAEPPPGFLDTDADAGAGADAGVDIDAGTI